MSIRKNKITIKAGTLLLAEPFMGDPHFRRAVILICDHHPEGTLGFILNKTVGMNISELIADFPDFNAEVYFGGPVQTDSIHYLHTKGELIEGSIKVVNGLYWGGSYEQLKIAITNQLIKPEDIKFYVGYTGWSAGQLQDELAIMSWITTDAKMPNMLDANDDQLWKTSLEQKGGVFGVIAQMPLPNWN